jgi:formate hydrogenlyase transcriptional activator
MNFNNQPLFTAEQKTLEMITSGADLKAILQELCRAVDAQTSNAMSTVTLIDPDGKWLRPVAGPRIPASWTNFITPIRIHPEGTCGAAAFFKRRVIVGDIAEDPTWPEKFREPALQHGFRAAWSQPLMSSEGEILGTLAMYYLEPRNPTSDDLELIEAAGRLAQITIERERSRSSLEIALREIKGSESKLRKIIDTIPTLAWCSQPDGTGEFWNKRWHDYTGLPSTKIADWNWQDAIHPEDLGEITDKWNKFLATGQSGEVEGRLKRFDGAYRWFLFRTEPLRDEAGNIVNWYGTDTDIDELKNAQVKLRQDEQELRAITDAIPLTIFILDLVGTSLYANKEVLDYTGLRKEEVVGADLFARLIHPEDQERVRSHRSMSLSLGLPFEIEQRGLGKDGQYRWHVFRYNPFRDEEGNLVRWYATAFDINDRKRAEDRTRNENVALREEIVRSSMFEEIVGSSEPLRQVLAQVSKVAPTDSTVLILGETGTGKELIARAIHNRSKRAGRAFIRINCAAIPQALIASELFGHEKGSFTGALQRRLGRFELADGGTIFLDEVGELPSETQIALLRVLQEREIERVGGNQTIPVDVRVLAATNRDLSAAVTAGAFRPDLFYRLNVFPIRLPALRERIDDIPLLAEYLIDRYAQKVGKKLASISKKTLDLFQAYDWPGNIRELQNVIERAVILCEGQTFSVDESWLAPGALKPSVSTVPPVSNFGEQDREAIENALRQSHGIISGPTGAAAKMGIPRQTLESRIRKLGINRYFFKS